MQAGIDSIAYQDSGFPVELINEADWRRAVRKGRLSRTTPVVVYRGSAAPCSQVAGEVDELRLIFDEQDAIDASPPPQPSRHRAEPATAREGGSSPGEIWDPGENFGHSETDATGASGGEIEGKGGRRLSIVAASLLLVVVGAVSFLAIGRDPKPEPVRAPEPQIYRVVEPANLRRTPVLGPDPVGKLRRNQLLAGVLVRLESGRPWLRITEGQHAGLYVWTGNLELIDSASNAFVNMN